MLTQAEHQESFAASAGANYRKPLLAAVLSACLPGMGQLYNGQANRAIWLFVAFCLVVAPLGGFLALAMPAAIMAPTMALWLVASLVLWIWSAWDAWRQASRLQMPPRPWQMSGLYAAIFLVCIGLVLPTVLSQVRTHLVHPVRIVSNSMAPTLLDGDQLFVDMRVNCLGCSQSLERGDIVVFTFPNDRSQIHIKRLIGLPSDRINIKGHQVTVNDEVISLGTPTKSSVSEPISVTVPPGHAYVLGDNQSASKDSRNYGVLPLRDIRGKARQIYFSGSGQGVRWHRIGQLVK